MMITQASATDWRGASLACRMAMGSTLTTPVTPPMYMDKMHYLHSNSNRAWSSAPRNVVFGLCCYIALLYITEFCLNFQWVQAVTCSPCCGQLLQRYFRTDNCLLALIPGRLSHGSHMHFLLKLSLFGSAYVRQRRCLALALVTPVN